MEFPIFIVDAFTSEPFGGNPAAVCLLEEDIPDEHKQGIAAEMNLSETAFVRPLADRSRGEEGCGNKFRSFDRFFLQWFTPTTEVPLCGHATLATAAVLFQKMGNENFIRFETRHVGVLTAEEDRGTSLIGMKLPLNPPSRISLDSDSQIRDLIKEFFSGDEDLFGKISEVSLSPTTKKLLVLMGEEFGGRKEIERLKKPDPERLTSLDTGMRVKGIIVTTKGDKDGKYDFVSRYFAPWVGIPEDPVTGSAHTVLGPFWAKRLGTRKLFARQCSVRGGEVTLEVFDDHTAVSGKGTILLEGKLRV